MTIHCLQQAPEDWLTEALDVFEKQFAYPLGENQHFSISHAPRYLSFFQALGQTRLLVAERQGQVLATLASVVRQVSFPDHSQQSVAYLADLKVSPDLRYSSVLARLLLRTQQVLGDLTAGRAYAVVMDGTRRTPQHYGGRLGLPRFEKVAALAVLSLRPGATGLQVPSGLRDEPLGCDGYRPVPARPHLRSRMIPQDLRVEEAQGKLEDTRNSKRLFLLGGGATLDQVELVSGHLSQISFGSLGGLYRLLHLALGRLYPSLTLLYGQVLR